ncbi:MAG: BrnT family toxin [Loktanella sp.]|nr:BrnT family toxin [Loktanella sp.]
MVFEWNEDKREQNLVKHGVDLLYAALIFENPVVVTVDERFDYGEVRHVATGQIEGQLFVVVYVEREDKIRLISARQGGRRDYAKYKKNYP